MPVCALCGGRFKNWQVIDGRARNLSNRKYCPACSPWGKHNTFKLAAPGEPLQSAYALSGVMTCSRCKIEKPLCDFYLRKDGRRPHSWCKECNLAHRKARFRDDRYAALLHYSYGDIKCACCGERTIEFLALDHVNNDGAAHRRSLGAGVYWGSHFFAWLRKTGYTYTALAVMCHNCNQARSWYGRCPHTPP
jgi:hypothetical protein